MFLCVNAWTQTYISQCKSVCVWGEAGSVTKRILAWVCIIGGTGRICELASAVDFLVTINLVSFTTGVPPRGFQSRLSLCSTLTLSSSSHFLDPVETQRLAVQSFCKTLDWALDFGWPHKWSCESSFLAKAACSGKEEKECKKESPALWLSVSRGG